MIDIGKDTYDEDEVAVVGEQSYVPHGGGGGTDLNSLPDSTNVVTDNDLIVSKENDWVKKTASKLWDYIKSKIGISNSGTTFLRKDGTWQTVEGHVYDVEMDSTNENMTLTEDGTDKTTLPLVATFVGTHQEWNALSAAEQAKYRRVDFTDDGGFGTAYQIPYGNSNVGDELDDLNSALPKFVSTYFDIPANTPVGTYNVGSLSTIFGISNLTQQRLVSIMLWVQNGNTGVVGDTNSCLIYNNNLYIQIKISAGGITKIGASAQYF